MPKVHKGEKRRADAVSRLRLPRVDEVIEIDRSTSAVGPSRHIAPPYDLGR